MKKSISFLILLMAASSMFAHDSNQAHFNVKIQDNSTIVDAEFPWTIRKALLAFAPELKTSSNKVDFEKAFKKYVNSNFILRDIDGNKLTLLSVEELENQGHSHQTNYVFKFEGSHIAQIENNILFNVNSDQTNFHKITLNSKTIEFKTSNESNTFTLPNEGISNSGRNYVWLVVLLVIPIIVLKRKLQ